jgi:hypothetical protein
MSWIRLLRYLCSACLTESNMSAGLDGDHRDLDDQRGISMSFQRFGAGGLAACALAATLAACGGGGGADTAGSGGTGVLRMALTDAPSCGYDHVYVTVDRVRVHQSSTAGDNDSGWKEITLATPKRLDLLDLTNGVLEELGQASLPAGRYSQVRLVLVDNSGSSPLANAVQPTGSALQPLATPSAQQSGLKLKANIDVAANATTDLLLDFDACRSVVKAGGSGNYNLKPVLSVTPRVNTGIQGYVSTTLTIAGTTVTAQQAGSVIRSTVPDATGKFVLGSLPAGSYDVVVASQGFSTAVVSSVPVTTTTTTVNGTATAILPPTSAVRDITGTVSVPGTGTTTLVTDASVRATQALTGSSTIEVAKVPVDATAATYLLKVPAAAPVRAPYAGTLTFAADAAAAGKYRVQASATGRTAVDQATDVTTTNQAVNLSFAP